MKRIHTVAASLAGIALTVAAVGYAQPFGMGPGAGPGFGPGMGMRAGHGPMAFDSATTSDAHLTDLKTQLKITTAQEGAWQAFADTAKQQASSMQAMHQQMQQNAGATADRMAQHAQFMQQRAASMTAMTNAFNALYAVLTPEQKAIADQQFGPMAHRGPAFAPRAG